MFQRTIFRLISRCSPQQTNIDSSVIRKLYSTGKNGPGEEIRQRRMRSTMYYFGAAGILTLGLSYAAVPLYRMFCQATSYGGTTTSQTHDGSKVENMERRKDRLLKIKFNADLGASMRWNFKPQQLEIRVIMDSSLLKLAVIILFWFSGSTWRNGIGVLHRPKSNRCPSYRNKHI